jgi:hypothetical protein
VTTVAAIPTSTQCAGAMTNHDQQFIVSRFAVHNPPCPSKYLVVRCFVSKWFAPRGSLAAKVKHSILLFVSGELPESGCAGHEAGPARREPVTSASDQRAFGSATVVWFSK